VRPSVERRIAASVVLAFVVLGIGPAFGEDAGRSPEIRRQQAPRVECLVDGRQTYKVAPRQCVIYEHGSPATTILVSMKWHNWGKPHARGRGRIQYYDHPEYSGRVIVGLHRIKRGHCVPGRYYTSAHVHAVSGLSKGNVFDLNLAAGCPA